MGIDIALTLTYRCPLRCRICLIEAGPDRKKDMPLSDVVNYLDQLQHLDIRKVALTGGEPFTVYDLLLESLKHATTCGLTTSTGTSAYWAKTKEKAHELLKPLWENGLSSISFSADEWHQEFVPLEYVKNGIEAAREIGLEKVIIQTTVTPQGERMKTTLSKLRSLGCDLKGVFLVETPATISGRAATVDPSQFLYFFEAEELAVPCRFIGTIVAIMPDGWMYPCCNAYPIGLKLGNARCNSLQEIIKAMISNPLVNVISSQGLHELARIVEDHKIPYTFKTKYAGICHLCHDLLKDEPLAREVYAALGVSRSPWSL
jgi:MoaA/NifB/PqqE/SkfB family radical SAM enzyme